MSLFDFALILAMLDPSKASRIDADVATVLSRMNVPGATVEVVQGGKVVYRHAYGYANLRRKIAAQVDTRYEIGSITKQFTAAAILQLRDAGLVRLDAPISTYLPNAPHASEITVAQCLAHTGGLPDYFDGPDLDGVVSKPATFDQVMARVAGRPLDFTPGSSWSYSNTGYVILGRIIEVVTHVPYDTYIRVHFLEPLAMTKTMTVADEATLPNMAVGYRHVNGEIEPAPPVSEGFAFSAGDLISTVDDLEKWSSALAAGKVIPSADYTLMATEQRTTQNTGTGYGFGFFVDAIDGQARVGHTGGSRGFTTADEYFPKLDTRIIAFTNDADGNPESGEAVTTAIFGDLYPEIAAQAMEAAAGEDVAITAKSETFFRSLQAGDEKYSAIASRLGAKLKARYAKEFSDAFAPYGAPTAFIFKSHRTVSGVEWYDYVVSFGPGVMIQFSAGYDGAGKVTGISFG